MRILVIGCGVIGSTYGYLFQKAGHTVAHWIRPERRDSYPEQMQVKLFDGRQARTGEHKEDVYSLTVAQPNTQYDFIFISVSAGKTQAVLQTLKEQRINGALVLFCGIWEDRAYVEHMLDGWQFVLGYPVAGGSITGNVLDCVVFDHVMLEHRSKSNLSHYDGLVQLLRDAGLTVETPYDMLEWIWLHMAINAGVVATAGKYGDVCNTAAAAEKLMDSASYLAEAVRAIRQTAAIIAARNVKLKRYWNELLPYCLPSRLAGHIMRRMFRDNALTRRIMTLHSNVEDLLYVCQNVYESGKAQHVVAPLFYANYASIQARLQQALDT